MKVIFTGDPIELERGEGLSRLSTTLYGVTFPMSMEVDVTHLSDVQKRKLLANGHFRAAGVDAMPVALVIPAMPAAAPAEAPSAESAAVADDDEASAAAAHAARAAAKRKKA